jgi:poly(3-hydroxybutyrate) depolymerase
VDKPIPVMIVNGTADPINPYRGGMVNLGGAKLGNVLSSEDTAKYWAKLLGVTAMPELAKLPHKGGSTSVDSMTWVKDGTRRDLGFLLQIAERLTFRERNDRLLPVRSRDHARGA